MTSLKKKTESCFSQGRVNYAAALWINTSKVYFSSYLCLELTKNSVQCHLTLGFRTMGNYPPGTLLVSVAGGKKGLMLEIQCASPEGTGIAPAHNSKAGSHHIAPLNHKESRTCHLPKAQDRLCIHVLLQRCKSLESAWKEEREKQLDLRGESRKQESWMTRRRRECIKKQVISVAVSHRMVYYAE